jgi:Ran GTPase-activating protein (RanGAP) involved in mRNA processing and transport
MSDADLLYIIISRLCQDKLESHHALRLANRHYRGVFDAQMRSLRCRNVVEVRHVGVFNDAACRGLLSRCSNLTALDASCKSNAILSTGLLRILEAVNRREKLLHLNLNGCRFGTCQGSDERALTLLGGMRALERLELAEVRLRRCHLPLLQAALSGMPGLTHLSLSGNSRLTSSNLSDASLGNLLGGLTGLRRLDVSHVNQLFFNISAQTKRLATSLSAMPHLRHLDISRNNLGRRGASALAVSLVGDLQYLDVSHNDLGWASCEESLNRLLLRIPRLKYLNLSHNSLGSLGLKILSPSFANLPHIVNLRLEGNRAHPEVALGVMAFVSASAQFVTLSTTEAVGEGALARSTSSTLVGSTDGASYVEFMRVPFTCSEEDVELYLSDVV